MLYCIDLCLFLFYSVQKLIKTLDFDTYLWSRCPDVWIKATAAVRSNNTAPATAANIVPVDVPADVCSTAAGPSLVELSDTATGITTN